MTLRGNIAEFPLRVVLRLLADASKTGELQLRVGDRAGSLGLASGKVICAVYGEAVPVQALGEIFAFENADFEFTPWDEAPPANLEGELDDLLKKADEHRVWLRSVREVIPNDGVRFRLSERAAEQGAVTFTSERWRVVLAVNGERDVTTLAETLHLERDAALTTLSGLVRDGVIETVMPPAEPDPVQVAAPAPPPPPVQEAAPPPPPQSAPPAPPEPAAPRLEWTAAELQKSAPPAPPAPPAPAPRPPAQEAAPPPPPEPPVAAAPQEWAPAQPIAPQPPPEPVAAVPPAPAREPALDDRLAALSDIFGPAPAVDPPPPPAPPVAPDWNAPAPAADQWSAPAPAAQSWDAPAAPDQWTAPAASAPAADEWATPPPAPEQWATPTVDDPRLAAMSAAPAAAPAAPVAPAADLAANEWAAPAAAPPEPQKKKGLFGFGKKEKPQAAAAPASVAIGPVSRPAMLAALSNALIAEYNGGQYGKARIDERLGNLLMRVDEQADPIDRPLPIVDDRIDVQALDRERTPAVELTPYLALLVATIYADAEKAFGKDKAKKGYKAAMVHALGNESVALATPEIAGKLPKI